MLFRSKAVAEQNAAWLANLEKMSTNFSRKSSTFSAKAVKPFYRLSPPPGRETPYIPSKNPQNMAPCVKPADKVYTGDKMLGIGTLHKSNAVPIFNEQDAIDQANMRR